ncbi:hypothetical protein [Streptomyces wuyuanensis]|uniref:hypothetical protein n=1 Tax=Streptomyces wuyuanensis TaxID=1196353 RepID=UPI003414BB6D
MQELGEPGGPYASVRSGGWWTAMGLNGAGGLPHVAALAYGPLSLVQPLGTPTVVFALPLAALSMRGGARPGGGRGVAGPAIRAGGVSRPPGSPGCRR